MIGEELIYIEKFIQHEQQGTYFTIPFHVGYPAESIQITYKYGRFKNEEHPTESGKATNKPEINIIDLGVFNPESEQIGVSGSNKTTIVISESKATPGYQPCLIHPGEWFILVGAYKVEEEGVRVYYEIKITYKSRRLLKGDLHTHTIASDGLHTVEELAWKAKRHGLDFVAITDHNQIAKKAALPQVDGLTLIPGVEWTHYDGHANFLGVDQPFDGCFATNSPQETLTIFQTAHERGALISINHPFEDCCPFKFDLNTLPFDCLEIWNGPMRESNLKAVGLWQSLLTAGKKIPAVAGSDYHRDTPFIFLGGPTTCVFAESNGVSDILSALRAGHAYFIFSPDGPELEMNAGEEAILGDTVLWREQPSFFFKISGLHKGDVVRVVTAKEAKPVWEAPEPGDFEMTFPMETPSFARIEVLRAFLPGVPLLPALLSNPIYFD